MCEFFQVFGAQLSILRGLISDGVVVVVVPGTLVPELHPLCISGGGTEHDPMCRVIFEEFVSGNDVYPQFTHLPVDTSSGHTVIIPHFLCVDAFSSLCTRGYAKRLYS